MEGQLISDILGGAAATCSVTSFLPQIVKLVRTRNAAGVSLRTYALTVAGFCLWVAYGARLGAWPVVVANGLALLMSGAVLALKWRYGAEPP